MTLLRRFRPLAALALLGVLWLGAGSHAWHHLTDHECESVTAPDVQPCATCSALHGGSIVSDPQLGTAGRPVAFARVAFAETLRPFATPIASGAPRAPPAA